MMPMTSKDARRASGWIRSEAPMDSHLKIASLAVALALCGALAAAPCLAQEGGQAGGDGAHGDSAGSGSSPSTGGGTEPKGGADTVHRDGDRGGGRNPSGGTGNDVGGPTPTAGGSGRRGNERGNDGPGRKVGAGPAPGSFTATPGPKGLDHGIDLIRPDDGYAGLHRRAIRKALIANAAKTNVGPLATGTPPQLPRPGVGVMRNAVGMAVPNGGAPGTDHHGPGFTAHTGNTFVGVGNAGVDPHHVENHVVTAAVPPVHPNGINGTWIGHIAQGSGTIGGPAKDHAGINGSNIRPRF
jgi:hypothetical protein